jgi:hypothetical protein
MASLAHPPPWHQVVAAGLVTAGLVLALAMLSEIVATAGMTQVRSQAAGWGGVLLRVAGLAGLLIAACMATSWLLDTSLIVGVMLAAPLAAVAWRALQRRAAHEAPDPAWLPRAVFRDLPGYRDQVTVLGGASFIATVAAAVVTAEGVIGLAIHVPSQPVVLCALAACVVVAAGQVGIGPLITVSLLGPVLSLLPEPPPPLLAATALMGGWGVVVGATPVAAGTLSLAKLLEVRASRIAQHWNGRFSLVSLMLLGAWLGVLHMLLE